MSETWLCALLPAALAAGAIAIARRAAWASRLADVPNERSLHLAPTPRVGGLGLMLAALPVAAWAARDVTGLLAVIACAGLLAALSLLDDLYNLPVEVRLPAHGAAAALVLLAMGPLPWGLLFAIAAFLAIAWMTNVFNFMDGADGLAGGMAMIGFGALAIAAAMARSWPLALTCLAVASAAAGFVAHNFPPARVFMGDAGSIPLGFLAAALGIFGYAHVAWPYWFAPLVFTPFLVDATVTLFRRLARGEAIWRAHRSHAYQRLILAGWSRRRLALCAHALMLVGAGLALLALRSGPETRFVIISAWLATHVVLLVAIERRCPLKRAASP